MWLLKVWSYALRCRKKAAGEQQTEYGGESGSGSGTDWTAGQPDLIVEVWSDYDLKNDRAFLQNLYATSDVTEHWYIEEDSNDIECYKGRIKLPSQTLKNILKTQSGLEFDLRSLMLHEEE